MMTLPCRGWAEFVRIFRPVLGGRGGAVAVAALLLAGDGATAMAGTIFDGGQPNIIKAVDALASAASGPQAGATFVLPAGQGEIRKLTWWGAYEGPPCTSLPPWNAGDCLYSEKNTSGHFRALFQRFDPVSSLPRYDAADKLSTHETQFLDDFTIQIFEAPGGVPEVTPVYSIAVGDVLEELWTNPLLASFPHFLFQYVVELAHPLVLDPSKTYLVSIINENPALGFLEGCIDDPFDGSKPNCDLETSQFLPENDPSAITTSGWQWRKGLALDEANPTASSVFTRDADGAAWIPGADRLAFFLSGPGADDPAAYVNRSLKADGDQPGVSQSSVYRIDNLDVGGEVHDVRFSSVGDFPGGPGCSSVYGIHLERLYRRGDPAFHGGIADAIDAVLNALPLVPENVSETMPGRGFSRIPVSLSRYFSVIECPLLAKTIGYENVGPFTAMGVPSSTWFGSTFPTIQSDGETQIVTLISLSESVPQTNLSCENASPSAGCTVNGVKDQPCIGTPGADVIIGTRGNDVIVGGAGDDLLIGRDGNDTVCGDAGRDILRGGPGNDTLEGGANNDRLYGGPGDDTLNGGLGHDRLFGGDGSDALSGGPKNDRLNGGDGDDTLEGGEGNDRLSGHRGADRLDGGGGGDLLRGGGNEDDLQGGLGADMLHGGTGIDQCTDADQVGPFQGCP